MWKLAFVVFTVIVASVTSAPSLSSEDDESETLSAIDGLIVSYRTRFLNDLEDYLNLIDKVEQAEAKYNKQFQSQVARSVAQARNEVQRIFRGVSASLDVAKCRITAKALETFTTDVFTNVTSCIARQLPSNAESSILDLAAFTAKKLFTIKDDINSCGGTINFDSFEDENRQEEDYEEYDVQHVEAAVPRENVNCTEVTAKVSEIVQEAMDSFTNLWNKTHDDIASIKTSIERCESREDCGSQLEAIVESVHICVEHARLTASAVG